MVKVLQFAAVLLGRVLRCVKTGFFRLLVFLITCYNKGFRKIIY